MNSTPFFSAFAARVSQKFLAGLSLFLIGIMCSTMPAMAQDSDDDSTTPDLTSQGILPLPNIAAPIIRPFSGATSHTFVYTFSSATVVGSVKVVTQGASGLDYSAGAGTTCMLKSYNAGDSCTVVARFNPTAAGRRMGAVEILDNSGNLLFETLLSDISVGSDIAVLPGVISTTAGNGTQGFSGDGGPATTAQLNAPFSIVLDAAGNQYIADLRNARIRKVSAATGLISTVAGNGIDDFSGDGGPAVGGSMHSPTSVAVDGAGNLYIADMENSRIRKVDAITGFISTVAGNGIPGFSGDGGPAVNASLQNPFGVAVDGAGNLYIADTYNQRIRKVDATSGTITTIAGDGTPMVFGGDGGPATSAQIGSPRAVALDASGNVYISGFDTSVVRKVSASSGVITTVAGNGIKDDIGPGGLATAVSLYGPMELGLDAGNNLFIADSFNNLVLKMDGASGMLFPMNVDVGNGDPFNGDNEAVTRATLDEPDGVAVDSQGNLYIADLKQERVRRVTGDPAPILITKTPGVASATYQVSVSNIGNAPLNFATIFVSIGFHLDNAVTTCSTSKPVAPGASCIIGVFQGANAKLQIGTLILANSTADFEIVVLRDFDFKAPTATTIAPSPDPSAVGTPVTFTATVSSIIIPTAITGSVTFTDFFGGVTSTLGVATLSNGKAVFSTAALAAGKHVIVASYSGDSNNLASISLPVVQVVQ